MHKPEADAEKLAVLTDKAEDLPSYLQSTTEVMYLYIDNEQLAERIPVPLLARLPLDAGGGQLVSPGYDDFRYPNNRSRPFHSDSSTSSWANPTASSSTRTDQQRRRPAPSGRKGSTGNRSPKRPHSPPTAANFSSDCLALSVVETVISSSNQRIFGSNVTLTCPADMKFATGVKRITTAAGPARLLRAGAPNRQRIRHRVQQRDFWRRGPVPVTATPDSDWLPARPSKPSAARETASGHKFTAGSGSSWSVSPRSSARPAALGTPPHRNASRPSSCLWRKTSPAADTNQLVPYGQNISLTCNEPGRPLANTPTASFRQCVYHPRPGFPQYWLSGAQPSSPRIDCAKAAETPGAEYGFFTDTRATSPASSSNASRLSWN